MNRRSFIAGLLASAAAPVAAKAIPAPPAPCNVWDYLEPDMRAQLVSRGWGKSHAAQVIEWTRMTGRDILAGINVVKERIRDDVAALDDLHGERQAAVLFEYLAPIEFDIPPEARFMGDWPSHRMISREEAIKKFGRNTESHHGNAPIDV